MLEEDGGITLKPKVAIDSIAPTKSGRVTLPHPNKDMPRGIVVSIYRQAGWQT